MDAFRKYIDSRVTITDEEFARLVAGASIKKLRRRQYLLQEGEVWRYNAFVLSGCLRTYSIDEKGQEHINGLAIENWWPGDCESLATGIPSKYNIDAIEDSEVLLIPKEHFDRMCDEIPTLKDMVNQMFRKGFIAAQNRINAFMSYTAEEKYAFFVRQYAAFANRVPLGMIASYLGITRETLSRIRRGRLKGQTAI